MGRIRIARGDTGKVLSNACASTEGWSQPFTVARLKTVTGVSYLQSRQLSVREFEWRGTFRFASRYPNATLDNKNELLMLAYREHVFTLFDLEGFQTSVQVVEVPEPKQVDQIKHYACYEVPLVLLREGFAR